NYSELPVRWNEPFAGNDVALGIQSAIDPRRLAALERSRVERVPTMTSAINLLQGGKGFLLYVPLYKRNEFDGFLLAVFRLDDWLHHALLMDQDQALGHHMHLEFNDEMVYRTVGHSKSHDHDEMTSHVAMFEHDLKIMVWPTEAFKASEQSGLPFIVGLFGIAISILTGLVLSLWSRSEAAAIEARRHQQRLKREVAERKAAQDQLHKLAYYDALTGLASRRLAMDRLNMSVKLAREQDSMMAILYIDVDGFKNVNDTWGHEIGDQLLCKVGDLISDAVRDIDTVARLGGDEFLVVLADLSQQQEAEIVAERIRASIAKVREIYNNAHPVKLNTAVSIGIAIYPGDGTSVAALLAQADAAMYESKKAGRNRCTLASAI
ncbi:MAG: sensor domain-containing diguanylate cyclase, partial [Gammaproteobacteria bacterium]|nr:sensor domain-containing diguanylate cyclase [Gammaproteobacteria bacterium]